MRRMLAITNGSPWFGLSVRGQVDLYKNSLERKFKIHGTSTEDFDL